MLQQEGRRHNRRVVSWNVWHGDLSPASTATEAAGGFSVWVLALPPTTRNHGNPSFSWHSCTERHTSKRLPRGCPKLLPTTQPQRETRPPIAGCHPPPNPTCGSTQLALLPSMRCTLCGGLGSSLSMAPEGGSRQAGTAPHGDARQACLPDRQSCGGTAASMHAARPLQERHCQRLCTGLLYACCSG